MKKMILVFLLILQHFALMAQEKPVSAADLKRIMYIDKDEEKVYKLIRDVDPADRPDLHELATDLTWTLQNNRHYREALRWAAYSDSIPFASRMYWLFETGEKDVLKKEYSGYISSHASDCAARAYMVEVLMAWDETLDAWKEAAFLQGKCPEAAGLLKRLYGDLQYRSFAVKKAVLKDHASLLTPEVLARTQREMDIRQSPSLLTEQSYWRDQVDQAVYIGRYAGEIKDRNDGSHTVTFTHRELSAINLPSAEASNLYRRIFSLSYKYVIPFRKFDLWFMAGAGYEMHHIFLPELMLGSKFHIRKRYNSVQLGLEPNYTATSIGMRIYKTEMNIYSEGYHAKSNFMSVLNIAIRYYSDKVLGGTALGRLYYAFNRGRRITVLPFAEAMYSPAGVDRPQGFPYWILKKFYLAGGGIGARCGASGEKLYANLDAAVFYASLADMLARFTGRMEWKISDSFFLGMSFEFYINPYYHANQANLGLRYTIVPRRAR